MKSDSFVSVVMVASEEISQLDVATARLHEALESRYSDFEIVIVKQGPVGLTSAVEDSLLKQSCIRWIQLASPIRDDLAWAAGLENAIGDFVVLFRASSDPVELVSSAVEQCRLGSDVIVGTARKGQSIFYRFFRFLATAVLGAIDYRLPKDATGFRCLSRRAVNAVTSTGGFHHQLYLKIEKSGYATSPLPYELVGRQEKSGFLGGLRSLASLVVFNSSKPLRWMSFLGILGSLAALVFAIYSVAIHLLTDNVVQGWTTTILFMSSLFLVQFIMLSFFGEYIGRLLDDGGARSEYSVVYERHSAVMVNADRVNVHTEPTQSGVNMVQTGRGA